MFRIANDRFIHDEKLNFVASKCLSETIKANLEYYFVPGYEKEKDDELYKKVDIEKVLSILPEKLLNEMEVAGVHKEFFLRKKMAEFMILLNSEKYETPDVFNEYLLYRILRASQLLEIDEYEEPEFVLENIDLLRELLDDEGLEFAESVIEFYECEDGSGNYENEYGELITQGRYNEMLQDIKNEHIECIIDYLTDFTASSVDDDSLIFWDWDFSFIDKWGFASVLSKMSCTSYGVFADYGKDYVKGIFSNVNIDTPDFLD